MARLLGEARVSILPDGTRFKPEAEAAVKKATAGVTGKIKLELDTKRLDAEMAAEGAKIIAMQNRIGKARQADEAEEAKSIAERTKMYAGMFDQINKKETDLARKEAAASAAQQSAIDRISKARQADALSEQKSIDARKSMYARMFDQISKSQEAADIAALKRQETIKAAQDKAWASYGKNLLATERMEDALAKAREAQAKAYASYSDNIRISQAKAERQAMSLREKISTLLSDIAAKVHLNDKDAVGDALAIREKLKLLLKDIKVRVRAVRDSISFGGIIAYIVGTFTKDAERAAGKAGNASGKSFISRMAGSFNQTHLIAAGVVAGLAALPAAVGAVGVLGGIALGAGLMFAAEKLIKSQIKTLTAQVKSVTSAIGKPTSPTSLASQQLSIQNTQATIARLQGGGTPGSGPTSTQLAQQQISIANKKLAIQNTQDTINRLEGLKKLTAAQQQQLSIAKQRLVIEQQSLALASVPLTGKAAKGLTASQQQQLDIAKQRLVIQQQALAASQGKGQGTPAQEAALKDAQHQLDVLNKQKQAFNQLDDAVRNMKHSFIDFAIVASRPLIKPFTDAINYLSGQMDGPLRTAFTKLFTAVGPLVKPVLDSLLELVKGVLPGLTQMLTQARKPLGDLFINFGKIVGLSLGQWFREAIPYIKDSSNYFLILVKILGAAGTFLIKFGGEFAKAFAGSQFKGFGKSIQSMADSILKLLVPAFMGWTAVMAPLTKIIIDIVAPILNFLAANPMLTKTIFGLIAAFQIFTRTLAIVRAAILLLGITTDIALGPWVLLGLAIAAAAYLVVKYWKPISSFFVKIWKEIWSGFIGPLINFFTESVPHAFGVTLNWLKKNWPLLLGIIGGPFGEVVGLIIKYHAQLFNAIKAAWGHIENVITGITKPLWSYLKDGWHAVQNAITAVHNFIWRLIKSIWDRIAREVSSTSKDLVSRLKNAWNNIASTAKGAWNIIHDYIINPLKKAWDWVSRNFVGGVKGAFSGLVSAVKQIWNGLKAVVANPINFVGGLWNKFAGFVNKGLSIFGIKLALPLAPVLKFAKGGKVPGFAPGSDTVPAMLSPGEYVINPRAVKAIGAKNLDRLNSLDSHHPGQHMKKGARSVFANGGDVVNDITKWNGHKYIWGGGANPTTGWDCSSFVNWIVGHDFKLNLPGGKNWAQSTNNGKAHGPVAASYNNWNYGHPVAWSGAKKGDLAIENNGAHIGFIIQDNINKSGNDTLMGFAARSTQTGTGYESFFPSAFHLERFADDRGFGSQVFDNTIGAVLKPLAALALNGVKGIVDGGLNHIPGVGPIPKIAKAAVDKVMNAAINRLEGNASNFQFDPAATGNAPVGFSKTAGVTQWEPDVARVLAMLHLPASDLPTVMSQIQTESGGNPNAVNLSDSNAKAGDPSKGLMQVISGTFAAYRNKSLSSNIFDPMANIYAGLNYAIHRYGNPGWLGVLGHGHGYAAGGLVPNNAGVFDRGGTLAPGFNLVNNKTGRPEHLVPVNGKGGVHVTLEIASSGNDFDKFLLEWLRGKVRVKGGGSVQAAFGKNR